MAGKSYTVSKNITLKAADSTKLRRAHVNNLAEEKKTKMHILKLQKALNTRCREIDKEKEALKTFMRKLHQTTGYFPRAPFW